MKIKKKYKTLAELEANHDDLGRFVKGHTIREVWTESKTKKKLKEILKILQDDTEIEICIIHHLMVKAGLSKRWILDIERKFSNNDEIADMIDHIKNILESRVWSKTANNTINSFLGLFTLKAYHNNVEKQFVQTQNENNNYNEIVGGVNLNIIYPENSRKSITD